METRRFEALELFAQGFSLSKIARQMGVSRATATRWEARMHNPGGMKSRKATGRPPASNGKAVQFLYDAGNPKPEDWTPATFRNCIQINIGTRYDIEHVRRMLKKFRQAAVESTERAG